MRSSWILVFVLIGIAAAQTLTAQTSASQTPDSQRCFSHDSELAIAGCTAMLVSGHQTQEQISRLYSSRAAAYIRTHEYDRAIQDLDQAIRRDPKYAPAFQSRGTAYSIKGQNDRAIRDFNDAIRLDPKSATSFYARGGVYNAQGQYDHAIQDFDQAIRLKPDLAPVFFAATFHERGLAYAGKGQYERAIQDYDQAIRLYPNLAQAVNDRSAAMRALGQQAQAKAEIAKARELTPSPVKQLTPNPARQQLTTTPPPPSDTVASVVAKSPAPVPSGEVTVEDLRKVTTGMSREQLLKLGSPTGRITMDEDGHLIEIFQYSANGTGLGTVRVTDGAVSGVRMH